MISGDYVEKPIVPELTYTDLDSEDPSLRQTYLWSVLYATGYLTDFEASNGKVHKLVIPNKEVLEFMVSGESHKRQGTLAEVLYGYGNWLRKRDREFIQ